MLYKNKKIIFLHIPKTGGDSIEQTFIKHYGPYTDRHKTLSKIIETYQITDIEKYTIFVVTRNPYERIFSSFNHCMPVKWNLITPPILRFEKYIMYIKKYFDDPENYDFKEYRLNISHIRKFNTWITDKNGEEIPNINILHFDNLNYFWDHYKDKFGIKNKLPHLNKTSFSRKNKKYYMYYNKNTRKIIGEIYKDEIEKFGYKFGEDY